MELDPGLTDGIVRVAAWVDQEATLPNGEGEQVCVAHHWLIDPPSPDARDLAGVCKICGAERTFPAPGEYSAEQLFDLGMARHGHGRKAREIYEDYLARLHQAENLLAGHPTYLRAA